jgi:hypothetical protein
VTQKNLIEAAYTQGEVMGLMVLLEPHPVRPVLEDAENQAQWVRWQQDLTVKFTLPTVLPRLRALLVMDNLVGHKTPSLMLWLVDHGVMPVFTPLGGSWLNLTLVFDLGS